MTNVDPHGTQLLTPVSTSMATVNAGDGAQVNVICRRLSPVASVPKCFLGRKPISGFGIEYEVRVYLSYHF